MHAPDPAPRRLPLLGWSLFALWLALTAVAFATLARARAPDYAALDARTHAAAAAWIDAVPGRTPGRPALVRLQPPRCACAQVTPWPALATRARARGIDVFDVPSGAALPPALRAHELLLVDARGHPVFLGPVDTGPMCGARHPVDALLASLAANTSVSAVVLDARCDCP